VECFRFKFVGCELYWGSLQGAVAPFARGPGQHLMKFSFYVDPIIVGQTQGSRWTHKWWADLLMVLCMGFAHGFGHDGF